MEDMMPVGRGRRMLAWTTLSVAVLALAWYIFLAWTQSLPFVQLLIAGGQVAGLFALAGAPFVRPARPRLANGLHLLGMLLLGAGLVVVIAQQVRS